MKKQIIASALVVGFALPAMADVSISGSGSYKYSYTKDDVSKSSTNSGAVEGTINLLGTAGASKFVSDFKLNSDSTVETGDLYLETNIGSINIKGGNFGDISLLSEFGSASNTKGKVHLSAAVADGVEVYAGNNSKDTNGNYDNNAYVGVAANVEGWKIGAAKKNESVTGVGVSGSMGPVGLRAELSNSKVKKDKGYLLQVTGQFDNVNVGVATIKTNENGGITQDDSGIFATSNAGKGNRNTQLSASIDAQGTNFGFDIGRISFLNNSDKKINYRKFSASRDLDSGVNLGVSYKTTDQDANGATAPGKDEESFEVKLSVAF